MVDVFGPHRTDHTQLVDTAGHLRHDFTNLNSRLPVTGKLERTLKNATRLFRLLDVNHPRELLTVILAESRLGIEQIHLAGTTVHKQLDHRPGSRCHVRYPRREVMQPRHVAAPLATRRVGGAPRLTTDQFH